MAETVNLPRDSTLRELVAVQKASIIASGNAAAIDRLYGSLVRAAKSVEEVNILFVDWWNICWKEGVTTRNELCERWFGTVLDDNRVHGTKEPLFATSQSAIGEATDDSVGLVCTPSTEAAANRDDFAKLPQFWALEVAAEKNADGTHTIYAVEFIDSYDDVRRSKHLCWVLQKNTYTKEWDEGGYRYFKMRCHPSTGYETWPQGTDKNGTVYGYIANPKYAAGFDSDGLIGCGSGRPPINYSSHSDNVGLWRKRGAQYAGASGRLLKWQLAMIRLKYARKGNSGTIEGCTGYSYQYAVSVGESGVKRVLLTAAQAANLFVGSSVIIGDKGTGTSTDRGVASMYKLAKNKRIASITDVTIDGTAYVDITKKKLEIGVDTLPELPQDTTDRNRTSPLAFTGNKFEFRMLGSSQSIASPNVVLNTIMADELKQFADRLERAESFHQALQELLRDTFRDHQRIIFDGNGYDDDWVQEAKRRGLSNLRDTVDCMPAYIDEKNVALFSRFGILTPEEMHARYEIHLENYCKVTAIEAATLRDMTLRGILPAVTRYTGDLAKGVVRKRQAEMTTPCRVESYLVQQLDTLSGDLLDACQAMSRALEAAPAADAGIDAARYYRDQVASRLEEMRSIIDRMEPLVGADYWPYPTYADILFSV